MSEEPDKKQSKKLTSKTFKKCSFKEDSSAETHYPGNIMSLVCEVCCGSSTHIRNEPRLRGIKKGLVNVDNYANGVIFIHLAANMEKH